MALALSKVLENKSLSIVVFRGQKPSYPFYFDLTNSPFLKNLWTGYKGKPTDYFQLYLENLRLKEAVFLV